MKLREIRLFGLGALVAMTASGCGSQKDPLLPDNHEFACDVPLLLAEAESLKERS